MGWSCAADAGDSMRRMFNACYKNSGNSNTWTENGKQYFVEISRREHLDGAITGQIMQMLPQTEEQKAEGRFLCKKAGSVRVEADGTVSRAPKFLKNAAKNPANDSGNVSNATNS
jgi:hypothetical protein